MILQRLLMLFFQIGRARRTGVQSDGGPTAFQRNNVQQHEKKRKTESGPKVFLPGSRPARALHQRPRLSDCLVRIRKDNCQGNPSNYDRLLIYVMPTLWRTQMKVTSIG